MKAAPVSVDWIDSKGDPLQRYEACLAMAKGYAGSKKTDRTRLSHAKSFCAAVVSAYWNAVCERHSASLCVKALEAEEISLPSDVQRVAEGAGKLISEFPAEDAGFLIGNVYTAMIPAARRSALGAFYTPPPLVKRLLDMAEAAGFDFSAGKVIDPACGGGAFLVPIAHRMLEKLEQTQPAWKLRQIENRLRGSEIDSFAAWIAHVVLEASVLPLCIAAKRRLADVVTVEDSLRSSTESTYDLVVGNPPYGRVSLSKGMRLKYARSLFGHANLYGLFTDLGVRLAKKGGFICYVTPTSFLGGQYFKALRDLLTSKSPPVAIDIVSDRLGVFDDVLQETMLAVFKKTTVPASGSSVQVSALIPQGLNSSLSEPVGRVSIRSSGAPWMLPRTSEDAAFLSKIANMPTRLSSLFYCVSTGPLVWNRHKEQLRTERSSVSLPLIWAESVSAEEFSFRADKRNHVPFIDINVDQPHLVTRETCVLVQRTTSKEQGRRLVCSVLPESFLLEHGGAVIENHLNMIYVPTPGASNIAPTTISALLNTSTVDRAFRCISGSVAVSAYELNALPLPTPHQMLELQSNLEAMASKEDVERLVASYYGIN